MLNMLNYIIITKIIKKIKNKFGNNKNNNDLFINISKHS